MVTFILPLKSEDLFCNKDAFNCSNGMPTCIPKTWVCDGYEECADGSDEAQTVCGKFNYFCHTESPKFQGKMWTGCHTCGQSK